MEKARLINIKIHLHGEAAAQRGGEEGSKAGSEAGRVGVSLKCSEREASREQRHDSGRTDNSRQRGRDA